MKNNKLRARIVEAGYTNKEIAQALNINIASFYRKLARKHFTLKELSIIVELLHLSAEEITDIFFAS